MKRLAALLAAATLPCLGATTPASAAPSYYLSLGDSLAVGIQPDAAGFHATAGYTGIVAQVMSSRAPGIQHINYGCSGATTRVFIHGGSCKFETPPYGRGSQLKAAERFLRHHRHQVKLVTIDIGANDILGCAHVSIGYCLGPEFIQLRRNIAVITQRLRKAAGPRVPMIGMTYYDGFLALYLKNKVGKGLAKASAVTACHLFNPLLSRAYRRYGFRVADVASAFGTCVPFRSRVEFGSFGLVPRAVARLCTLSWACDSQLPDIHLRDEGYAVAARAFLGAIGG